MISELKYLGKLGEFFVEQFALIIKEAFSFDTVKEKGTFGIGFFLFCFVLFFLFS